MIAIYTRQSIFKKDSLSTAQQADKCIGLCDDSEYQVFEDLGYSGKNLKRPGFEEMMKLIEQGMVSKLLVYKLDRISRNISDFSNLIMKLQDFHCELVSVSENFDTSSPIGRAMIYICMVFAQMERENVSQRVHDNYYYRTELGFWGGGTAPYGYQLSRVKYKGKMHTILEPDEEESKIVNFMYHEYLDGNGSITSILRKLNMELKIPSRKGGQWTSRVVADILTKPLYTQNDMSIYHYLVNVGASISSPAEDFDGMASVDLYGKKTSTSSRHKRTRDASEMYCNVSNHDAIIDSATWLKVQTKKQSLLSKPSRSGTGRNSYFTGLMKCSSCGASVSFSNANRSLGYYLCSTKKNRGYNTCPSYAVSKKLADPLIIESIIQHFSKEQTLHLIREAKVISEPPSVPADGRKMNQLKISLHSIEQEISSLLQSLTAANDVLLKYINEKILVLDAKKNSLQQELFALEQGREKIDEHTALLNQIGAIIDDIPQILHSGDFDEIRDLCKILVKQITFCEDKSIDIEFTI